MKLNMKISDSMKRFVFIVSALLLEISAFAQTEVYKQRYDLLVSKFGPDGVGVETVLDNWEKADSTDVNMLAGRFNYYFTKAQTTNVVTKPVKKYLGKDPLISLKDSTGTDVNYFQETVFDDELYGMAVQAVDRLIAADPDRIDSRFLKANAYVAYEKESPDMAVAYLLSLIDEDQKRNSEWFYGDEKTDGSFFEDAMLEYCFSFYSIGTPSAMDAFFRLSEKMSGLHPDNPSYINNIGTYYLIAKEDYKTAMKYYNKVLKAHPDDYTAIKNCVLVARKQENVKMEKKYLQMLAQYGPENEKLAAQARLKRLEQR